MPGVHFGPSILVVGIAAMISGCGGSSDYVMKPIVAKWTAGDQPGAVKQFVATDWSRRPIFDPTSPTALSEVQFGKRTPTQIESDMTTILKEIKQLREIAQEVVKAGQAAAANNDTATAKAHFNAFEQFGQALDDPQHLKIVRLIGASFVTQADVARKKANMKP